MDLMKHHCELLLYFDKYGTLLNMKNECEKFLEQMTEKTIRKFPPFNYYLDMDVINLYNKYPDVGEFLIREPLKWRDICGDILYSCLNTFDSEVTIKRSQINIILTIRCLPEFLTSNLRFYKGLVLYQGILITYSKPASCIVHSVWSCPEDCEDNEVILKYIPKLPPKCHICRSVLFENSSFRRCGEEIVATFLMQKDLLSRKFKIPDYLFDKLSLGSKHNIIGVVIKNTCLIWSVEVFKPSIAPTIAKIPQEIATLFNSCKGIPWMFIYCLASSIGFDVCPLSCFMHLKINLLLSLSSVLGHMYTDTCIVNVLVAGFDTGYVEAMMAAAAELANTSVSLSTTNACVQTALISGTGGITLLPLPLQVYNQKPLTQLLSSMESGEVILETEKSKTKLQTAVWAHGMDFKKFTIFNIASVFGSVCRGDIGEYSNEIVDFQLQNAVEKQDADMEVKQALNDIRVYLDSVAGLNVKLSPNAESLLKSYFLAARKDRPRGVSVRSMNGLIALCLASTRLCQRNIANIDDAVFAIWLYESGSPEPRSAPEEYLQAPSTTKVLDKNMSKFKDWLEEFTGHVLDIQNLMLP